MTQDKCPFFVDSTGQDVHAEAEMLRERGPLARVELPGGVEAWTVTSYALAETVLADKRVSKDAHQHWPDFIDGRVGQDWPLVSWVMMDNMTTAYGANHARLRKIIARSFTPKRISAMRPHVEKIVADLLDEMEEKGRDGHSVDLKATFSYPLPVRVICDLFGIPEERRAALLVGGEKTVSTQLTPTESADNVEAWTAEFQDLITQKRRSPGEDLTSDLIAIHDEDPSALAESELIGTLFLALGAGSETVMNLVGRSVVALLSHPEQLAAARRGDVSWEDVVEEALRVESPIAQLPLRFATEDLDYGDGLVIPKGDPILIGYAAVGRDPEIHGDTAREFDIHREDKSHLSFGHGIHFCLGSQLARLEAAVALPALFDRYPDLTLEKADEDLEPQGTFIMNGNATIPVLLRGYGVTA